MAYSGKATELQFVLWFLQNGWGVFTPLVDLFKIDLVVIGPKLPRLLSVQIKGKDDKGINQGYLEKDWTSNIPPFDYLVFYQAKFEQGLILPKRLLEKSGYRYEFNKKTTNEKTVLRQYRKKFVDFIFDLRGITAAAQGGIFIQRFAEIHEAETTEVLI